MKVLIVEDNHRMQQLLTSLVASIRGQTASCDDGDEAVAAYAAFRPDWVLMDLQMARVGGLDATRGIRTVFPSARIIVVTQYDDAHYRAAAIAAGACGYVLKDDLVELLRILDPERRGGDHADG